ncbi:MAG: DegV family protein [Lachnospiraceae bacterium]|nr:DegV family protein [Lachnospiraceae bacterium]
MKIKILSDSTCDLSEELLKKYDIDMIPLTVVMGERSGKDGIDITPEDIYEYVEKSGRLPATSATNIFEYKDCFTKWTDQGYSIVHISLGSGFSSSYQNASIAAEDMEEVYVVDSNNLSSGQGLLVLKAGEMKAAGCSAREIYKACMEAAVKVESSFVIDSLDYLYKGGRCSALATFGGNLLKIKPSIDVKDGKMGPSKKYRGKIERVIKEYVRERIKGRDDIDTHRIILTHTKCSPEIVKDAYDIIREEIPDAEEIPVTVAGATVTTHCGPNTLGVMFLRR